MLDDLVDDPVRERFLGSHEVVPLGILLDLLQLLTGVLGEYLVEPPAEAERLAGVDLDVRRRTLRTLPTPGGSVSSNSGERSVYL